MIVSPILRFLTLFNKKPMAGLMTLAMLLGAISPALARFDPGGSETYSGPTATGAPRGCNLASSQDAEKPIFTALAPQQRWGNTVSTRPTLVWFVPENTYQGLQLSIYRKAGNGWADVLEGVDLGESQPGYMSYTPSEIELTVGESYLWQVELICDLDSPDENLVVRAPLTVLPGPGGQLTVSNRLQQAEQFASAGFWYDALALLTGTPLTAAETAYRRQLLLDLAEAETTWADGNSTYEGDPETFIKQLQLIADVE